MNFLILRGNISLILLVGHLPNQIVYLTALSYPFYFGLKNHVALNAIKYMRSGHFPIFADLHIIHWFFPVSTFLPETTLHFEYSNSAAAGS